MGCGFLFVFHPDYMLVMADFYARLDHLQALYESRNLSTPDTLFLMDSDLNYPGVLGHTDYFCDVMQELYQRCGMIKAEKSSSHSML